MWNRMGSMLEEVVNECMSFVLLRDGAIFDTIQESIETAIL